MSVKYLTSSSVIPTRPFETHDQTTIKQLLMLSHQPSAIRIDTGWQLVYVFDRDDVEAHVDAILSGDSKLSVLISDVLRAENSWTSAIRMLGDIRKSSGGM